MTHYSRILIWEHGPYSVSITYTPSGRLTVRVRNGKSRFKQSLTFLNKNNAVKYAFHCKAEILGFSLPSCSEEMKRQSAFTHYLRSTPVNKTYTTESIESYRLRKNQSTDGAEKAAA